VRDRTLDRIAGKREKDPVPLHSLMSRRVRNILLVSSLYDSYTLEEDGGFNDVLSQEYASLNLSQAPRLRRASNAAEALEALDQSGFDLVVTTVRVGGMSLDAFSAAVKRKVPGLPVVALLYTGLDFQVLKDFGMPGSVDRAFFWQGDSRLFLAMIKWLEDRHNMAHDSGIAGVRCIILVEDSVRFYSSYLPLLYTELMQQTQALMNDAVNQMQRLIRMRARPKILHARNFEEAKALFLRYSSHVLGVILDVRFDRAGIEDPQAGIAMATEILRRDPECPILFQSSEEENRELAVGMGASFINKGSPTLLSEVRQFMRTRLGFGDFVFRNQEGIEEARARDLGSLFRAVKSISDGCLLRHADRNDFSTWLMARTEFDLALALKPQRIEDFRSTGRLRDYLLSSIKLWRDQARAGQVEKFSAEAFDADTEFARIGSGSLGGKGRGLAFLNALVKNYRIERRFQGVRIRVPNTVVLTTDAFDRFLDGNSLLRGVLDSPPDIEPAARDVELASAFLAASLPDEVCSMLRVFIERIDFPIAVRSSSLLEDSPTQPYAGIYSTYMLANNHPDPEERLAQLCDAVKLVYASLYLSDSVSYTEPTPNRLEEEKMAVVIQRMVGDTHGDAFYPGIAGVARSFNFYPLEGMREEDGIASVALGLGATVMGGGKCVRFSPASPGKLYQFSSTDEFLRNSQSEFLALDLADRHVLNCENPGEDPALVKLDLDRAQEDGTLPPVGSVYSADNDMIIDGTYRTGARLVTMAGVLKGDSFPLAPILAFLLDVGKAAFSCEVEIEFAVNLTAGGEHEFGLLQIRPMGFGNSHEADIGPRDDSEALCICRGVLGSGRVEQVTDIIYVSSARFERKASTEVAGELEQVNRSLRREGRHSLLIGPGRWGSADTWLGIPVKWGQISSARCIVETPLEDLDVTPSQGTHFFQNITSLGIGYFTVTRNSGDRLDTAWLDGAEAISETAYVKHIRLDRPLEILIDRKASRGVIHLAPRRA
jgi:hypothetical protein